MRWPRPGDVGVEVFQAKLQLIVDNACRAHIVSRGAQKCFLDCAEKVGKAWEVSEASFNEHGTVVAEAIAFRWTDRMVATSAWCQEDRGYKAQVVTCTPVWLVNHL